MTQPQTDPADDVPVAIARLAEQLVGVRAEIAANDRLYLSMIEANAEKVALALTASDKALGKAETASEKRFDAVNEFRQQLADQTATFPARTEVDAITLRLTERIQELTDRVNKMGGREQGVQENKASIIAAIGVMGVLISIIVVAANFLAP